MLTFFRRIRKGLLSDGATSKYLLYAFGEIVLVVVGILIALQINNWNEQRREKTQIAKYLSGLVQALNDDINYLNYTIQGNSFRANCIKEILFWTTEVSPKSIADLEYRVDENWDASQLRVGWTNKWMNTQPIKNDPDFIEECILRTSFGGVIVSNQSTLEEFKNTGLFSNIQNEALKQQINFYYALMDWHFSEWRETNYRREIEEWEVFLRDRYQVNTGDISSIHDPLRLIKNNRSIQLQLENLGIDAAGRVSAAGEIREKAKTLIVSIENHKKSK